MWNKSSTILSSSDAPAASIVTVRTGWTSAARRRFALSYFTKGFASERRCVERLPLLVLLLQRRDPRCLTPSNITSHHLTHSTTPVTVTSDQRRTSSMTSIPLSKTSAATDPSTRSSTSRRRVSTPQPPTSRPAEGLWIC